MRKKAKNFEFNFDDKVIKNIVSVLKSKDSVKIGVIGNSVEEGTSVEIAATHEFGRDNIPQRSFLRLTAEVASDKFQKFISANAESIFKKIIDSQWLNVLDQFGAKWVGYVHETFETKGWGQWPALKDITLIRRKNPKKLSLEKLRETTMPLQDTGALLRSITHEVSKQ